MAPEAPVYLGLGSNLGNRLANLRLALRLLAAAVPVRAVSPLYETMPVGVAQQPPFYNAVCCVASRGQPRELLRLLKVIEWQVGRRPGPRWGPRPIDLDILLWGRRVVHEADLVIPHPRLHERAFVLVPLGQLAPDVRHPLVGKTVRQLLAAVGEQGVRQVGPVGWERE